ncbi:SGNH/GDSL hydrolase family protein [Actinomycetospora termitidis]|uniref:SGNH/GDSL hydrolase family protein n=1 Tax=Actinomycetospora termitidis TaxID=3053470 RepID=A0ABT7MG07_9PSEU|nr:SGNH/GDSL hydrolase family protein [Actinomycetospora sp. Odt1-22]MDL5159386.1 SGNH/GDSL hydrolase family protein [Actinomycetospora sp. Odt1-22]
MGVLDAPAVNKSTASLLGGRAWGFLGDSITNGSSAAVGRSFTAYLPHLVGTAYVAPLTPASPAAGVAYSINGGVAGQRSDQMLARIDALLGSDVKGMTLLAGTNDAQQGVSTATFMSNVAAIAARCRRAGVPLVVGTVPPRGAAASSAIHQAVVAYNLALRAWAPGAGVQLAEVNAALVDPTSGAMLAAYDSGDNTHPNTAGHRVIAEAFAAAVRRVMTPQSPLVVAKTSVSLVTNPLFPGNRTSWFEQPGGTGTAPTYSTVPDVTGRLPAGGQWAEMYFDGTTSGGTRTFATSLGSGWSVGDLLLMAASIDVIDVTGYAAAALTDPQTASFKLQIVNNGTPLAAQVPIPPLDEAPGDIGLVVAVPSGATGLSLWFTCIVPTGVAARFRIGAADVLNLTALGVGGF